MKRLLVWALVALASLGSGGCNSSNGYLTRGIGVDLNTANLPDQTQQLDTYTVDICRQAGIAIVETATGAQCSIDPLYSTDWAAFVQAGMNDIDRRCDGYLQWLDDKRRELAPMLQQIGDTQTAVDAGLTAARVAEPAIGIVAAAFGFARNTYTNFNSRLVLEVDHSTVQSLVLTHQNDFRKDVLSLGAGLNNRPAAIYVLRSYLRLCLPYTIETQINATIVTYERGGPAALANAKKEPLINPIRAASMRLAGASTIPTPGDVTVPSSAALPGALGDAEKTLTASQLARIQTTALCVPKTPQFDAQTRAGVKILEDALHRPPPADRLSKQDLQLLAVAQNINCPKDARNYFESSHFFDGKDYAPGRVHELKTLLNRAQPTSPAAFADKDADERLTKRRVAKSQPYAS